MLPNLTIMWQTSTRLLQLLAMLQARRDWSGRELASRLEVSTRTIRTDIERLRDLGYPVEATPGVGGGYRLGSGATMPPLLLDDDEVIAVSVGLRTATGAGVTGIEEASLRALVKLEQLMPSRLRHRIDALRTATVSVVRNRPNCGSGGVERDRRRDSRQLSACGSTTSTMTATRPYGLPSRNGWSSGVAVGICWPGTWRETTGAHSESTESRPSSQPGLDSSRGRSAMKRQAQYVQRSAGTATWRYRARIRVHAPADQVRPLLPLAVSVSTDGPDRCIVEVGSDTPHQLALYIGLLDTDFDIFEPPELAAAFVRLAERYQRAAKGRSAQVDVGHPQRGIGWQPEGGGQRRLSRGSSPLPSQHAASR